MQYKLGKKPPANDKRNLKLSNYLSLNEAPPECFYENAVDNQNKTFPMYGNDKYGDCTCAAAGHMIEVWTANNGPCIILPDQDITSVYFKLSPDDNGCDMNTVLNYWRQNGFGSHKITGYVEIDLRNKEQFEQALYLFGTVYLGVSLPNAVVDVPDMLKVPWYLGFNKPIGEWEPNPENGHCIPAIAYDNSGSGIITWGAYKTMDWAFYDAYVDEAFAVLSPDWLTLSGKSPTGLNLSQLQQDLSQL